MPWRRSSHMPNVLSSPDLVMGAQAIPIAIPIEAASRNGWRKNCADFLPNRTIPKMKRETFHDHPTSRVAQRDHGHHLAAGGRGRGTCEDLSWRHPGTQ